MPSENPAHPDAPATPDQPDLPNPPDLPDLPDLPEGWVAYDPGEADVDDLVALLRRHEREARGWPGADSESVAAEVVGRGASMRRHLLVRDVDRVARGWVSVHDRAPGRVLVGVTVDPNLSAEQDRRPADAVALFLFAWAKQSSARIGVERGLADTQLDSGAFAHDPRQQAWLNAAGFAKVRTWWQMVRPVTAAEVTTAPQPREGVTIRRVRRDDGGPMPAEEDLRTVHAMLEASFADHFNNYRESFEEFVERLRADPGHRWDHWWIAELAGQLDASGEIVPAEDPGAPDHPSPVPAGAVVSTAQTGSRHADGSPKPDGSYIDYIGVHRRARGRGVAKALLWAVIADAAERGRDRVGLEVDAESPTGAQGLYTSMGWQTRYVTESWHLDVPSAPAGDPGGDSLGPCPPTGAG